MYNLLIVDDEVSVVKGLAYDIEWSDLNITGIYKAFSVTQAVQQLEQTRIDIVITDISMPEMSGIQLAEIIKSRWKGAVVIFLSGYDDFEYAQKAVELGIFNYITKTVEYEFLKQIVSKAVLKLEEDLYNEKVLQTARESLEQARPILQERYLNTWIVKGTENPLFSSEKASTFGLDINVDDNVFLTVIRVDENERKIDVAEDGVLEIALKELASEWFLNERKGFLFSDDQDRCVILFKSREKNECVNLQKYMEEVAEPFSESVKKTLGCIISIFFSEVIEIEKIHEAYRNLNIIIHRMVSNSSGIIMLPGNLHNATSFSRLEKLYESPDLTLLVESLNLSKALDKIDRIFEEVNREKYMNRAYYLEIYNVISGIVIQASARNGLDISKWVGEGDRILYNFELINNSGDLKNWCKSIIRRYIEYVNSIEKKQSNHIVEQAKKLVGENYHKEISVTEIASYLYLHPNYLTRMFKTETGMSLMDYISKTRIEHAKSLLAQPGFKVYEVAERIGYESVANFNKIFKRETGMSPKEYQKLANKFIE